MSQIEYWEDEVQGFLCVVEGIEFTRNVARNFNKEPPPTLKADNGWIIVDRKILISGYHAALLFCYVPP